MDPENVIYVVEPDQTLARAVTALLGTYGISVDYFSSAESFLDALEEQSSSGGCLLLDASLPGINGVSLVRQLSEKELGPAIIVVGDKIEKDQRQQLKEAGATDVVDRALVAAYLYGSLLPGHG